MDNKLKTPLLQFLRELWIQSRLHVFYTLSLIKNPICPFHFLYFCISFLLSLFSLHFLYFVLVILVVMPLMLISFEKEQILDGRGELIVLVISTIPGKA